MENYKRLFSLEGKTALITGGTSGLGHAIAGAFLQSGANVIVCSRNIKGADDLKEYADSLGMKFLAVSCDITNSQDVDHMIDEIGKSFDRVDILVNSAGINILAKAEDYDEETFNKVLDINVKGTHYVTRAVGKRFMIPQQYGRIVNLSSVKGTLGASENYLGYCTSKGAVNMYTKQIACEWGKYNITANAIAPTFVRTNISARQLDDKNFYNSLVDRIPLGRIGSLEDIASGALYLCSDAAGFVTGQILHIDGGMTSRQ